ncbi:MAG: hypothetical protein IMY80_04235 [Chloroflexi bacterium]|jgi:hypothetical protein|nr:hypothetical protein [Chloroflexota bacterium]
MQYFIYISKERVDELFETAFDHVIDGIEVSKSKSDKSDGNAGLTIAGIFKTSLSFGRADSESSQSKARITAVSRLKDVVDAISKTQTVLPLADAINESDVAPADWYLFQGSLTGKNWERGSVQVILTGSIAGWEIRLSCRAPDFSGLYKEGEDYIPTSTNYFLFEGEISLSMIGLVRIAHISREKHILRGSPLFLILQSEKDAAEASKDVAF